MEDLLSPSEENTKILQFSFKFGIMYVFAVAAGSLKLHV